MQLSCQPTRQEQDYFCIPAVVQAILRRYGREETQTSIAKQLGFQEGVGVVFGENMAEFFSLRGLAFDFKSPNQVMMRVPQTITDEWQKNNGDLIIGHTLPNNHNHVYLATSFSSPAEKITLLDPKDLSIQTHNLDDLYNRMCQTNMGGFGLVSLL